MIDPSFLKEIDRFKILVKKKTSSKYRGEGPSKHTGEGLLFKDFRKYYPGDDIRYIDWKLYARTNKFFIKIFEEERELTFHILIDISNSMDYGKETKFEYAAKVGLAIAYLVSKQNNKFHFSVFDESLETLDAKASKSNSDILKIIDRLNAAKLSKETKFIDCLGGYDSRINSKALIVIVSDFLFNTDEIKEVIQRLKKNEILLLQVLTEEERLLQIHGDSILQDAETKTKIHTYISKRLRQNYIKELNEHIGDIENIAKTFGINFITTTNNVPLFETLFTIVKLI